MRIYKTITFVFLLFCIKKLESQTIERYNSFSYSVNEGLLQSTISDIAFDKNNFCWISFPNGIQKFDGKNFITVPVQSGLPDDKLTYFFKCSNGDLLISHSEGISKYEITNNRFIQIFTWRDGKRTPAQFIGEDEGIVYTYLGTENITGINYTTYKVVSETKTVFTENFTVNYTPKISDNIINHKVAFQINSFLYLWDLKNRKMISQSAAIPDISRVLLRLKTENEILYYTYKINNALQLYNFATNTQTLLFIKGKDDKHISRCVIFPWQNKLLLAFSNKLYETDTALLAIKSELVNFQNQPIAGISGITKIIEDNFGNLSIQTVRNGIIKVIRNNYPIKYYGTSERKENVILSLLPDKRNNRIFAGTNGNGLLIFDTLQRLIKHIKTLPGKSISFSPNTIIKTNKNSYLLFNSSEKNVWELSNDLKEMNRIPISTSLPENRSGINYFGNFLFQNEQEAVIQSQSLLYKTNFSTNTVQEHEITTSYTMSGLLYNDVIITHANDELIYLNASTFKEIKRVPLKNTGYVRCFTKDKANNIYVGSNKGIFKIDKNGKILKQWNKEKGLPDECIYAMVIDDAGFLWCSTNKGILRINKDNTILQLTKEDGLQENEFNTNAVAKTEDGEIFFAGVNGISSFYPFAINSFEEKINLLFTNIKINNEDVFKDTAAWKISKIELPYHQNTLSFDFIAMANNNPDQYIYQYKMQGIDEQWIQNSGLQTVRYYLPPGEYVFKIYASRVFNKDAAPMKEIHILIHPPFWKTWWFITALAVLVLTLLTLSINRYNKSQFQKKLILLEGEQKMQTERERISRDLHDSLGAYANAVLYNTELLQEQENKNERDELIKDLRFASKDIITALRETIWALKKDNYTAQECLLRIKNFIQPFASYYKHINFKVEGETPAGKTIHHSKAFNLVRIVQEAVSNAIKHANAKNIFIYSIIKKDEWQIIIKDDGHGFHYASAKEVQAGNGLNNMKQRAMDAKVIYSIESEKNIGTTITIIDSTG